MEQFERRRQQVVYDAKWHKLLKRAWLFTHIPFVDFAFGAGSMAVGNVTEISDFDVLVGARQRRIFTARFFAILFFGFFGWRRTKHDIGVQASDKICLNHFITPAAYRFSLERNPYWEQMYQGLVPICGDERFMRIFLQANEALITQPKHILTDARYQYRHASLLKRSLERLFAGRLGEWFEKKVKAIQIARIEAGLRNGGENQKAHRIVIAGSVAQSATYRLPPLIRYSDTELEFHPDPAIIEMNS